MTEQTNVMQDALVSIIQKTQQGIDASVSFLSEQIPDVIQQLLMWKFVEGLVYTFIGVLLLGTTIKVFSRYIKKPTPINPEARSRMGNYPITIAYDEDGSAHPGIVALIVISFISFIISLCMIMEFTTSLKIYIAPKVYLIEYAASLVK